MMEGRVRCLSYWTFRRRLIVWTIIYFCKSLSRCLIFMDRQGIWCSHLVLWCAPRFCAFSYFFSMFVNCLSERIRNSEFHFHADELQIYLSGNHSDLDGLIARVNEDLEAIHRWLIENGLLLHSAKLRVILVSNSPSDLSLPLLFLGEIALDWKDVVTHLGLLIDYRFRHVTKICPRVYSTLDRLQLLKFLTPKSVQLKLCKALFLLHYFYCDIFFYR
jgi:hypothetical protein